MSVQSVSDYDLQAAVDAQNTYNNATEAAKSLGLDRSTFRHRLEIAKRKGIISNNKTSISKESYIKKLEFELKEAQKQSADAHAIK